MKRTVESVAGEYAQQGLLTLQAHDSGRNTSSGHSLDMSSINHLLSFTAGLLAGGALIGLWPKGQEEGDHVQVVPSQGSSQSVPLVRSSGFRAEAPARKLELIADVEQPLLRESKLVELGYEWAGFDLEEAMRKIDSLKSHAERIALLKGIFTRVAEDKSPYEAIQRVKRLVRDLEPEGFRALMSTWVGHSMPESMDFRQCYSELLSAGDVSQEIKKAWMKAYENHPQRSAMLATWAGELAQTASIEDAEALGAELTGWERGEFIGGLALRWIGGGQTEKAWEWIQENREDIDSETLTGVFDHWHLLDEDGMMKAFDSLTDPECRVAAATGVGKRKAMSGDTPAALAWADSLPSEAEQDAAHEAIYKATPRGIGAALDYHEGSVIIREALAGTPAAASGLKAGDHIVGIDPGSGEIQSVGSSLEAVVNMIRGEPGTGLRLRVLRSGGETEVIDLQRQQLVFQPSSN